MDHPDRTEDGRTTEGRAGPTGRPLTGNLREFQRDRVPFFERCLRRYGRYVPFRVGNKPALLVVDPDGMRDVLADKIDVFERVPHYRANRLLFGDGLFRSEGELWERQHRMIDPNLTHDVVVGSYLPAMLRSAERDVGAWRAGDSVDAVHALLPVSLNAAAAALWGADLHADDAFRASVTRVYDGFDDRLNSLIPWSIGIPNPRNLRLKRDLKRVDGYLMAEIGRRRSAEAGGDDLLSRLARARDERGEPMPDRLVRDEVASAVQAAYRPTPVALGWAWYLLDRHPDVEAEMLSEIAGVLGGRALEAADVDRLAFTRLVMLESLRLYSPVHMTGRVARVDADIVGHAIAKGTTVLMEQHLIHRDGGIFEDPDAFRPRRWEGGLRDRLHPFAFTPFSAGPRGCVGGDLAFTEMVALLALVATRFHVRTHRDVDVSGEFLLQPRGGMPVTLEPRG